ncbi:MAG: flavin monoamine oxidase family protein [Pseudomonadales bacterium]
MEQVTLEFERLLSHESLPQRHVAVIGAGIAGLVAAHTLALLGQTVTVFEASPRVAGRILTHRYAGQHAELGAMRIPESHQYTLFYCRALSLPLEPFVNSDRNAFYRLRGKTISLREPARLAELFDLTEADSGLVARAPALVLLKFVDAMLAGLSEDDRAHIVSGDIAHASPAVQSLDAISVRDYLLSNAEALDSNREGVEMIGSAIYLREVWQSSCVALLREFLNHRDNPCQVAAGMEALPQGLARRLGEEFPERVTIHRATPVTGIRIDPSRAEPITLTFAEATGRPQATFTHALCTLPFPVLRHMVLEGFSAGKCTAIDQFRYAASTKVLLNFRRRFWEAQSAPIHGGASITDQIAGQIFYPSSPDAPVVRVHPLPVQYPSFEPDPVFPERTPSAGEGPGVVIGSYAWGSDARRLAALPAEARIETVRRCLAEIHGSDVDAYFDGGASMAWETHRWSGGAFSQPGVRGLALYRDAAMRPEHTLHFSGEHLSADPGWIQGSISSTWRALAALIGDLTRY